MGQLLSYYLRRVQNGERFHVTVCGKEIADVPADPVRAALWRMVEAGEVRWSGGKPAIPDDLPVNTGRPVGHRAGGSRALLGRPGPRSVVILCVDTSAPAKAVLLEAGTDRVGRWFHQAEQIASSVITYAEACAALDRKHRLRGHDSDALRAQLVRLDAQWSEFLVVPVDELSAGRVARRHHLRGMDAVQLGAALRLRDDVSAYAPDAEVAFAAFDRRLLEAAEREGLAKLGGPLE